MVIGDSCKDIYRFGYCERISPEAPVPILKIDSCKEYFGMAANVFQNIKSLGNEAFLFTQEEKIIKTRIVEKKFNHHILRIDEEPKVTPLDWKKYKRGEIRMCEFSQMKCKNYDFFGKNFCF